MKLLAVLVSSLAVALVAALALGRRSAWGSEWTAASGSASVPRWVWDSEAEWGSLPLPL